MNQSIQTASLVFDAHDSIANDTEKIILDTRTLQVFYDHNPQAVEVLVLLPNYFVPNPDDYYPNNSSKLTSFLEVGEVNIVIQNSSRKYIDEILAQSKVDIETISENDTYTWLKVRPR